MPQLRTLLSNLQHLLSSSEIHGRAKLIPAAPATSGEGTSSNPPRAGPCYHHQSHSFFSTRRANELTPARPHVRFLVVLHGSLIFELLRSSEASAERLRSGYERGRSADASLERFSSEIKEPWRTIRSARGALQPLARWADTEQRMNHTGDGETDQLEGFELLHSPHAAA